MSSASKCKIFSLKGLLVSPPYIMAGKDLKDKRTGKSISSPIKDDTERVLRTRNKSYATAMGTIEEVVLAGKEASP